MKQLLLSVFILVFAAAAFAQNSPDYNGTWVMDAQRTKLDERMRIESITLKIKDSGTEVTKETTTKRSGQGGGPGGRGMGGGLGIGDGVQTVSMDGKDKTVMEDGPRGPMSVKIRGKREKDGRVVISSSRNLSSPMGEIQISTKETWSLSADGKTLTVTAEVSSPVGANSNKMYFTRQ